MHLIQLHPEFITKNGKKEFAVLPYEEFLELQEKLADLEDLQDLRVAKQAESESAAVALAEVKRLLNLSWLYQKAQLQGWDLVRYIGFRVEWHLLKKNEVDE